MNSITKLQFELMRYIVAGLVNTMLTYGVYLLLLRWLGFQAAYAIAYVLGVITQFFMHTYFVYRVPPTVRRLLGYPGIHLVLYAFGAILLHLLANVVSIDQRVAALIVIVCSVPVGFVLTRTWLQRR